jgi:predicted nucleic acid-binding protein
MKVLVDTSAWSLALRRAQQTDESEQARQFLAELISDSLVEIIGPVRQELLTGVKSQSMFNELRHKLNAFADIPLATDVFERAAEFANICRAKGIQGSHTDFLICAVAATHNLAILTYDKDFDLFAKHLPIKLYKEDRGRYSVFTRTETCTTLQMR